MSTWQSNPPQNTLNQQLLGDGIVDKAGDFRHDDGRHHALRER
jgi:hypothetical protein